MNLKVLSVFALFCLLQVQASTFRAKSKNFLQSRIVGGKNANRGDYPYNVLLTNRRSFFYFCGGSIITNRHILTAAHCIQKYKHNANELFAILNTVNFEDTDITVAGISRVYGHPEYRNSSVRFDISILLTRREIKFNDFIQPVLLPSIDYTQISGHDAVIAGWGAMWEPKAPDDFSPRPNNLQFQHTTTLGLANCWASYKQLIANETDEEWIALDQDLDPTIICTANNVGSGTCLGDSGSGVVVNNVLVGIVSSSLGCAKGYPDIHTNVYPYLEWIGIQMERFGWRLT